MLAKPNNSIAADTLVNSRGIQSTIINASISPEDDVDLYQLQLNSGEGITLDIDADQFDSSLDSVLRLFDSQGNELGLSDDLPAPGEVFTLDPYLTFVANTPGDYYVGVSSVSNNNYSLFDIDRDSSDVSDDAAKSYDLEINIVDVIPEEDSDDTIPEAISTELDSPGESATFSEEIDVGRDIDIYQLQLDTGDGLILDIDASEFDSSLDSQLRLFDADGNELASNDDSPALGEDFTSDSYLSYTAEANGDYYVGVSTAGNDSYDALNGRTNLFQNSSINSGSYELNIDIVEVESDNDFDNTISEANSTVIASNLPGQNSIAIEDSIDPQGDVDVFELYLDSGDTLTLDLNAAELETGLDSALLLFDSQGNEIDRNDDAAAPGEDSSTIDSYLEFTADTAGNYYVGISGFPNVDYDVINGRDNLGFERGTFSVGDYELVINSLDNLVGTDEVDILFGYSNSTLVRGLEGDDSITGGENNDYLAGDSGDDTLSGNNGNDTLIGGTGFDFLSGGGGADVLQGDSGNNMLRGGIGADIFVLNKTNQTEDTIIDFEDGTDKILLADGSTFDELEIEDFTAGIGVTLSTTEGNAIAQIIGINQSDLSASDFVVTVNESVIE